MYLVPEYIYTIQYIILLCERRGGWNLPEAVITTDRSHVVYNNNNIFEFQNTYEFALGSGKNKYVRGSLEIIHKYIILNRIKNVS